MLFVCSVYSTVLSVGVWCPVVCSLVGLRVLLHNKYVLSCGHQSANLASVKEGREDCSTASTSSTASKSMAFW